MPMMDVRKMRMFVRNNHMPVPMFVRLCSVPARVVFMLVMLIVRVTVRMLHWFVPVHVFVFFRQV
jgi:hypothetical protein